MIHTLQLTNFRRFESLSLSFSEGLNVIRGGNEHGKSTSTEAILYALFGARALREPLAATVTYGKPESTLRVVLTFSLNEVMYTLTRHKGGAELVGGGATVTGQNEVTQRTEALLGGSADKISKLAFAAQNDIRGALAGGPGAATALIETLSNLSVLDDVVTALQAGLPNGSVSHLQALEKSMEAQLAEVPVEPVYADSFASEVAALNERIAKVQEPLAGVDVQAARDAISQAIALTGVREAALRSKASMESRLAAPVKTSSFTESDAQSLREQLADKREHQRALAAYALRVKPYNGLDWSGTYAEMELAADETARELNRTTVQEQELLRQQAVLTGLLINETTCGFCKKDLSQVPEVVAQNTAHKVQLEAAKQQLEKLASRAADLSTSLHAYDAIRARTALVRKTFPADYYDFNDEVPPTALWRGPVPVAKDYAAIEAKLAVVQAALQQEQHEAAGRAALQRSLTELVVPEVPDTQAQATLVSWWTGQTEVLKELQVLHGRVVAQQAAERQAYAIARAEYNAALDQRAATAQTLATVRQTMRDTAFNNDLIRKIRAARPLVANKLWAVVTAAISRYFTQMRGESSTVARTAQGFTVNGRPVAGLSGSTLDVLGLAIRTALVKTFLPNMRLLILDEPAAGCDDQREINMLGLIASIDAGQVLLITHSNLADSFADKLIEL